MTFKGTDNKERLLFTLLPFAALFFLVLTAYANGLFGEFLSDDIASILEEPRLKNVDFIWHIPFRTARNFVIWVAYAFGGTTNTFPYHLVNMLIHFGFTTMVYLVIRKMSKNWLLAFISAAIVAVHPLLSEAVSWISGGVYAQAGFFLLLSFYFYISKHTWQKYTLAIVFFVLSALTSPERAFIYPIILVLYEICFGDIKKNWRRLLVFFAIAAVTTLQYVSFVGQRLDELGVKGDETDPDTYNPLVQVPTSVISYLQLFFWPDMLTIYHTELTFTPFDILIRSVLFLLYVIALAVSFKKDKFIFFWLSFFIIALLPTLTPFKIAWLVAERYVYLSSVGLITALVYLILKFTQKKELRIAAYGFFLFIVILLSARTIVRNNDWKNQDNLWIATDRTSPSSHNNHNNLGDMYTRHGDYQTAVKEFERAIQIKPDYADAYHNLANVYKIVGQSDQAFKYYNTALQFNPYIWQSYHSIAELYFSQGSYNEAIIYMQKALEVSPNNVQIISNIGVIYREAGDKENARMYFLKALELFPESPTAQAGLASLETP